MKKCKDKSAVLKAIEALINLEETFSILHVRDYLVEEDSEAYQAIDVQLDYIYNVRATLVDIISEYVGLNEDDFIGFEFEHIISHCASGNLSPREALMKLNGINVNEKREEVIEHYLDLLKRLYDEQLPADEYNYKFNVMIGHLFDKSHVPDKKKMYYSNLINEYIRGNKDKEYVIDQFHFYIHKQVG